MAIDAAWSLDRDTMDTSETTGKQREKHAGGVTGKGFRPRTAKFAEAARRLAEELGQNGKTGAEQLAEHCYRRALKGSARHELFLAYSEGKPKQGVELSGPDGGAMRFESLTEAELDARLQELLRKYRQEQRDA
jgi:hypothetical protein